MSLQVGGPVEGPLAQLADKLVPAVAPVRLQVLDEMAALGEGLAAEEALVRPVVQVLAVDMLAQVVGGGKVRLADAAHVLAHQDVDALQVRSHRLPGVVRPAAEAALQGVALMGSLHVPDETQAAGEAVGADGAHKDAGLGIRDAGVLVQVRGPVEGEVVAPVYVGQHVLDVLLQHLQVLGIVQQTLRLAAGLVEGGTAQLVDLGGVLLELPHSGKGLGVVAVVGAQGAVEDGMVAMPGDYVPVQESGRRVSLTALQAEELPVLMLPLPVTLQSGLVAIERQAVPADVQLPQLGFALLFVTLGGQMAGKFRQTNAAPICPWWRLLLQRRGLGTVVFLTSRLREDGSG